MGKPMGDKLVRSTVMGSKDYRLKRGSATSFSAAAEGSVRAGRPEVGARVEHVEFPGWGVGVVVYNSGHLAADGRAWVKVAFGTWHVHVENKCLREV
jgi:hypothetical protein